MSTCYSEGCEECEECEGCEGCAHPRVLLASQYCSHLIHEEVSPGDEHRSRDAKPNCSQQYQRQPPLEAQLREAVETLRINDELSLRAVHGGGIRRDCPD